MNRIIVVDDEKSIRITFKEFLERENYEVFTASNVEEALLLFKEVDFDVVITDIVMPRMSGMELLKIIYEKEPNVPVIVMTGEPSVDTAMISVKNNAYDYLLKPVNKVNLIASVKRAAQFKEVNDEKEVLRKENLVYQKNLEELVGKRTNALQKSMHSIILTITEITELRDPYTSGHERRVGNLALAIGKKLNLSKKINDSLYVAGYLHDLGKISIPTEILSKPGKLSKIEYEMIKTHVECGYKVLKNVVLPWDIAEIVRQHHERLDGSGYPRGLKDKDIMQEAKIMMVADVVEAMTSRRPYRAGLGIDIALEEISKNKGKLYDQTVVDATLDLFRKDNYVIEDQPKEISFEI